MTDGEYPCALCGCAYWKHYVSVGSGQPVCLICVMDTLNTAGGKKPKHEPVHSFIPDNLRWLELKYAETNSYKAMPGISFGQVVVDDGSELPL